MFVLIDRRTKMELHSPSSSNEVILKLYFISDQRRPVGRNFLKSNESVTLSFITYYRMASDCMYWMCSCSVNTSAGGSFMSHAMRG